jgi:alkylhydroperoxidase/carboxymuconolactone decarboxylase family protein YurZ
MSGIDDTVTYLDGLFGPGAGLRHVAFVDRFESETMRDELHRCHAIEADTRQLTPAENYLLGACVLYATGRGATAGMFVKTLCHLGVPRAKILEAIARLAMWVGGIAAAEASQQAQRAIAEWDAKGVGSLEAWFPNPEASPDGRNRR